MTNRNSNLNNRPFLLKPAGKDYLWGGSRLNDDFSKGIELEPLAETWECSTHPDGPSVVASGPDTGKLLPQVLSDHPEYIGSHPRELVKAEGELPILIKFIDARKDLSVQVHPDDAYARQMEHGSMGKSEMWYVLDASRDARLVYGFRHDMDREVLKKSLLDGTVEKYLQKVKVRKDDVFYIEAGTVHALGAGALVAEIQESSNLTYRMYDYNRVDKDGKKRQLHVEKALDVVRLQGSAQPRQPMRVLKYQKGCASELLCRCRYFQTERLLLNTERCRQMADFQTGHNTFQVLLCTNGCGVLFEERGEFINFFRGDCIFVPADSVPLKIHGKAQLLRVSC
ncbi:MAG: class I mannose-6-phosphate isomerase [Lachnospiraceae bacterium]|nr:class I mannose-6-phosphate isomerase [Lachnospiraceae bacterium]MDD7024968.1 class I mannose-6-phosphate isomerase [Oscillospiraceae bacterium]MDY5541915.1 type I phosphomannose isomerase catalytic subunit [Lachnospiraceae bacterium]MDY5647183.1 type I phosphomannose isomerase catalytic subunit [Lachnospiraceae bacterium]